MSKVNWIQLKKDYISDETTSHESLSQRYGVSTHVIAERASKEKWVELRKETLAKAHEKLLEKTSENIANFQAKKLRVGQFMVDKGVKTLSEKDPRNAREAKEVIEIGYKIATEAMELDKPQNNVNVQVNVIPILGGATKEE